MIELHYYPSQSFIVSADIGPSGSSIPEVRHGGDVLVAGTFGRGAWLISHASDYLTVSDSSPYPHFVMEVYHDLLLRAADHAGLAAWSCLLEQGVPRSQVVLMGRHDPELTATPWLERRDRLWPAIAAALDSLLRDFDRVVLEGAGSPAEPNLMRHDLVNLAVARRAGAACYLVADVDRGGAFAHLLGTWQTMDGRRSGANCQGSVPFGRGILNRQTGRGCPAPPVLVRLIPGSPRPPPAL